MFMASQSVAIISQKTMRSVSVAVILALIVVTSGQFAFWKRLDTAVCYQFYGECLTKYSQRAGVESENCHQTRNSSVTDAESKFSYTMKNLIDLTNSIRKSIDCGSMFNKSHIRECFQNIARNNINNLKEVENESTKAYRLRSQQEEMANAIANVCLSEINFKASEAIQEIDGILRSCYMTGKSVTPQHEWFSEKPVTTHEPTTTTVTTTVAPTTTTTAAPSPSANRDVVLPLKEIEPIVDKIAGKIKQNADGWFTDARNKFMSLIR
ncbi:hypothetical protein ACFFRR_002160 [Megaselia abdita]